MAGSKQFTIFTKFAVRNNFSGPVLAMAKGADKFAAHAEKAGKVALAFGKATAKIAGGIAIGATAAGAAVFKLAQSSAQAADDILNTAAALGLSTKALQEYRYVGIAAGLTTEEMDAALKKLTVNLGKGSEDVSDALAQIGLTADQLKAAGPDKSLEMIAEGFSKIKDPSTKAAFATTLFGKSSVRMVNALSKGSAGIADLRAEAEKIGYVMDGEALDAAGNLDDTLDKLGATITGVGNRLAAKAIPGVTKLVDAIQKGLMPGGNLSKVIDKISDSVVKWVDANEGMITSGIGNVIDLIGKGIAFLVKPGVLEGMAALALGIKAIGIASAVLGAGNPFVLLIAGIVTLVTLIVTNWDKISGFFEMLNGPEAMATRSGQIDAAMADPTGMAQMGLMRGGITPMSPASSTISSSTTTRSMVDISVGNLPPGSTVVQDKPAPGVTLSTGRTVPLGPSDTGRRF